MNGYHWIRQRFSGLPLSVIFHLASIPGGMAEQEYELANAVNLDATRMLLELGKVQTEKGYAAPVFVFASSIAVFGDLSQYKQQGIAVSDETPVQPSLSYGAHKRIGEILVDDFTRREWVDGRSLRIPGVLVRPAVNTGQISAFLSDIIRHLSTGHAFICPVSKRATTWASSRMNVVDNLLHAAGLSSRQLSENRTFTLPTQCFSMEELVDAISQVYEVRGESLVTYAPHPEVESLFGQYPRPDTQRAEDLGFRADVSLTEMVKNSMAEESYQSG